MSPSILRLSLCAVVVATLAGCGGGSSNSGSSGNGGGNTSPTTVTVNFQATANSVLPSLVATQIGTGAYALATLSSGKLTIEVPNGETRFAFAYLCPSTSGAILVQNLEYIVQASTLDGTSLSGLCLQQSTATTGVATLQVNAAAIPGAAWVALGDSELPWSGSTLSFSSSLATGTYDVPVTVSTAESSYDNLLAVRILRSQTIPGALNSGAPVVFATSDAVAPQTISYNNVPTGFTVSSPFVFYQTANGASILLDLTGPSGQYLAMPSGAFQTGDYYSFSAGATGNMNVDSPGSGASVGVQMYTSTGGTQSITFPAPWLYAGPTAASLPTFNFAYTGFSGSSHVSQVANESWYSPNFSMNQILISSTANYQNGSTSMTVPNLSSLTGFLTPLTAGTIYWTAEIVQGIPLSTNPPSGTAQFVANYGTYALP